jgi:hypothetical protein
MHGRRNAAAAGIGLIRIWLRGPFLLAHRTASVGRTTRLATYALMSEGR